MATWGLYWRGRDERDVSVSPVEAANAASAMVAIQAQCRRDRQDPPGRTQEVRELSSQVDIRAHAMAVQMSAESAANDAAAIETENTTGRSVRGDGGGGLS